MAVSVYPERMDQIDPEDVEASLRTLETYIHYICERTEFALTNTFRTTNDLGESASDLSQTVKTARGAVEALGGQVTDLSHSLDGKVDKVEGKGLSANDYTDADRDKLAGIDADAEVNVIESVKRNGTALPVSGKAVDVTVPTKVSDLTNDSGYQTSQQVQAAAQAAVSAGLAPLLTAETYGPASPVSFAGLSDGLPLKSCLVDIAPAQAGSGDPSPTNVRAITGRTGANLYVSPTTTAGDGKTYAVDWTTEAGTVYGGTLDVLKGTLTVTRASVLIGDKGWSYSSNDAVFYSTGFSDKAPGITNLMAEAYKTINVGAVSQMTEASVKGHGTSRTVYIKDTRYSTAAAFRAAMGSSRLVYALAAPITYQLTPQMVTTLAGANNIWADTGDVTVEHGAYLAAMQAEIEKLQEGGN